ncbi:calcium-binding protein [Thalassococcus sp. BH17M4-6]|uniref:calcium-binding protein n=1 Tax=Thalassococcus sp. BH17M4-6 TaxID=3413148 RepID=UPI003BF4BE32
MLVSLYSGIARYGDAAGDSLVGIENLTGSDHDDRLYGDIGANVLEGGLGNDSLYGSNGDDSLNGGYGGDLLDGGSGIDTASYAGSAAGVLVSLYSGIARYGDAAGDSLVGIENLTGSDHDDRLYGDIGANVLEGGLGNDSLYGSNGDDSLNGGGGSDFLDGGPGSDTFVFGQGSDQNEVPNFEDGSDLVALSGGITYSDLTISSITGGVRVSISQDTTQYIDLYGVALSDLSEADFV